MVLGVVFVFVEWLEGGCYINVEINCEKVVCYGMMVVDV